MNHNNFRLIRQSETYVKVDRIPKNLNFLEKINFCNIIKDSIDGVVLRKYRVSDYIVHVYTDKIAPCLPICSLLLEQVGSLLNLVGEKTLSEVWVVREMNEYYCFGIFKDVPMFFKSFNNIDDMNKSISAMCEQMNTYSRLACVRLFAIGSNEVSTDYDIFEYSFDFIKCRIGECMTISEYCVEMYLQRINLTKVKCYLLVFNIFTSLVSVFLFFNNRKLADQVNTLKNEVSCMHLSEDMTY